MNMFARARLWLALTVMMAAPGAFLAQTPLPTSSRAAQAEAIVDAILAREFAKVTAQFDDAMKAALPADAFATGWDRTAAQAGKLVARRPATEQRRGAYTVVVIACQFEKTALDVTITFNAAGQIAGLQMRPPVAPWTPPSYAPPSSFVERDVTVGKANGRCRGR
jgi:hypothetical protein